MDKIEIYADGACRNNQITDNIGAVGVVLRFNNKIKEIREAFKNTTNNRMEILAVIKGLQALKRHDLNVVVYSDSQYVVNTLTKNWARNKNQDLWQQLDYELSKLAKIDFIWVKGHDTSVYNNRADQLANIAMNEILRI